MAASDGLDGYVARRFDQVTRFGAVADRSADRATILTAGFTLGAAGILPWWLAGLVIGRDVLLLAVVTYAFRGPMPAPVTRTGKAATALLLAGFPALLAERAYAPEPWPFSAGATALVVLGLVLYYASGLQYGRRALRAVRQRGRRALASDPSAGTLR